MHTQKYKHICYTTYMKPHITPLNIPMSCTIFKEDRRLEVRGQEDRTQEH